MPHLDPAATAIVTVSYNSHDHLERFLQSAMHGQGENPRVVVADNGSDDIDGIRRIVAAAGAELLETGANLGYGGAINAAVATLPDEIRFILVSNPDVELQPGAVAVLQGRLESDPTIGAAGPKVLNPDGTVYPSARRLPTLGIGIGHSIFTQLWPTNPWSRRYREEQADSEVERDTGWLSGSCLLIRRSAFESLGGFDDAFFMYFEDVDLGARLVDAGLRNRFVPASVVVHTGGHSTKAISGHMLRVHHASASHFIEKRYPAWYFAPVRLAVRVSLAARYQLIMKRARAATVQDSRSESR
ncbi:glycosyltransferase family 2 protein [Agromyces sp. NPDC058136]|uniref:glycosyltransferase family 2 protein n=1 Tax=Agromyces sp. NPDC058136 TaxID=3346354 RepID=UPI0036DD9926